MVQERNKSLEKLNMLDKDCALTMAAKFKKLYWRSHSNGTYDSPRLYCPQLRCCGLS